MSREGRLLRQSDIINSDKIKTQQITIVGCGGIGSHLALALARMGAENILVIDPDVVSIENVSSQGFDMVDIGKPKVDVMKQKIIRAVGVMIKTSRKFITEAEAGSLPTDTRSIVVAAVDSMESRRVIAKLLEMNTNEVLFINPAMAAEYLTIDTYETSYYTDWHRKFEAAWFSDDDGVQESCTAKATIYTTLLMSGFICKIIKDKVMRKDYVKQLTFDIGKNDILSMFDNNGVQLN